MSKAQKKADNPEIEALKQQINDLTEALQRERADAVNVRRRAEEDRLKMSSYFKASVVKQLLPFIDNFERALQHVPKTTDKATTEWLKGLESVNKQLSQALETLSVKKIKTVGEVFDPKIHEAVQMDTVGSGNKEIVTEEFMSGYSMDDEILRHAMVKVAIK